MAYGHRTKYLCTTCRISMSRIQQEGKQMKCGRCGSDLAYIHHKFRAPNSRDLKFWDVIRFLETSGQLHQLNRGYIPKNMKEAQDIVRHARMQEIEARSPSIQSDKEVRRKKERALDVKRRQSRKGRRWAKLAKFGKA